MQEGRHKGRGVIEQLNAGNVLCFTVLWVIYSFNAVALADLFRIIGQKVFKVFAR